MESIPNNFSLMEIAGAILLLTYGTVIAQKIGEITQINAKIVHAFLVILSIIVLIHGLNGLRKKDKTETAIKEHDLDLKKAELVIDLNKIDAEWDIDWEEEEEGFPSQINVTNYEISIMVTNRSSLDNGIKEIKVVSKNHGKCNFNSFIESPIKGRSNPVIKFFAELKDG